MCDALREELIGRIAALPHGIFGRELCVRCQEYGNYEGWASAMLTHRHQGRFFCLRCSRLPLPKRLQRAQLQLALSDSGAARRAYIEWYAGQGKSLLALYEGLLSAAQRSCA